MGHASVATLALLIDGRVHNETDLRVPKLQHNGANLFVLVGNLLSGLSDKVLSVSAQHMSFHPINPLYRNPDDAIRG